jgi:UDP-N-acetyl-D-glucosamine dehydrogenase
MKIAVIGLGQVGLQRAIQFAEAEIEVVGIDADAGRVEVLNRGLSYLKGLPASRVRAQVESGRFRARGDFALDRDADALIVCIPTPRSKRRQPEAQCLMEAGERLAPVVRPGTLVVWESNDRADETAQRLRRVIEAGSGLSAGAGFHWALCRTFRGRGNAGGGTSREVVSGLTAACRKRVVALYRRVLPNVQAVRWTCGAAADPGASLDAMLEIRIVYASIGVDLCDRVRRWAGTTPARGLAQG